jgi:ubiquinone/menaquinone biosynthesis C-methylase UbiE
MTRFLHVAESFNRTPTSFLDAGCRDGAILTAACDLIPNLHCEGIDIVPSHVSATDGKGFKALIGDIHSLPYPSGHFDAVYCSQTLEHCHNPGRALSELFRVAKHIVFVGVPLEETKDFEENLSHYAHTLDPYDWLELFKPHADTWLPVEIYMNTVTPYLNSIFVNFGGFLSKAGKK